MEKLLFSEYYFTTWKGNETLVRKLDDALIHTQLYRPEFQSKLQAQFFPELTLEPYSVTELAFIESLPALNVYIKKANAAKSDFLSTMSHDIRTPMNAIMGIEQSQHMTPTSGVVKR